MLQEISYICIGKGIRKCCSIDSLSDTQCLNTEQFYHSQMLEDENDLIDNDSQVFQGKNAYFPLENPQAANPDEPEEDPDEDVDQETIFKNQKFHDVSFDKSQILKKNGPLTHPDSVLCSDTLRDRISFYS